MIPDVTVVIPAYDSMPYVTRCVESVFEQSLPQDRIEIIAVDDGSTDGTGEELDRLAAGRANMRVMHEPNSGSPARPRNLALDIATGRYVFFLDADDHFNAEALERMVRVGDEQGADLVLGKPVGTGGRRAPKSMFAHTQLSTDVFHSRAWWLMSPMKLHRRAFIEELGLRFPEDFRWSEDQPFSGREYLSARVITILADYEYLFFDFRDDGGNVTLSDISIDERLHVLGLMLELVCGRVQAGPDRDHLLKRHFEIELFAALRTMADSDDEPARRAAFDRLAEWVERLFSFGVVSDLSPAHRIAYVLLSHRDYDRTMSLMAHIISDPPWRTSFEGARAFADYPFFRDAEANVPDECFDITSRVHARHRLDVVEWRDDVVHIEGVAYLDLVDTEQLATDLVVRERDGEAEYRVPVTRTPTPGFSAETWGMEFVYEAAGFSADVPPGTLAGGMPLPTGVWDLRLAMRAGGVHEDSRIGRNRAESVDATVRQHVVPTDAVQGAVVASYFTADFGNLSLDVGFSKHSLKRWFAADDVVWSAEEPATLLVTGSLGMLGLGGSTLGVVLDAENGRRLVCPAVVSGDRFSIEVPIAKAAGGSLMPRGRWVMGVEARVGEFSFSAEPKPKGNLASVRVWRWLVPERARISKRGERAAITISPADPVGSIRRRLSR
jgi:CDP-glycerol glycerophosphotransferase